MEWAVECVDRASGESVCCVVAARVLGVSCGRMRVLMREGRVGSVRGMPGGLRTDVFVPLEDLVDAPFLLNTGRPGVWGAISRKKALRGVVGS